MEKKSPHYSLTVMQAAIAAAGKSAFTVAAIRGGAMMNMDIPAMLDVVAGLTRADFYKSMTTHANHRVWQDVYHATCPNGRIAYIKLTQVAEHIVIQFKEK